MLADHCGPKTAGTVLAAAAVITAVTIWLRRIRTQHRGHIAKIIIYPIKSCRGISVQMAKCTPLGLEHGILRDRCFMIVDSEVGNFIFMNENPLMVLISPSLEANDSTTIRVDAPGMDTLYIDLNEQERKKGQLVTIDNRGMKLTGYDCGNYYAEWLQKFLKNPNLRLVYLGSDLPPVKANQKKGMQNIIKENDLIPYSFTTAYTLNSESSHEDMNKRLKDPVPITNFRPNITISGSLPYEEDKWDVVKLGSEVVMETRKLCQRCVYVNINADDSKNEPDVLKTLLKYRKCRDENLNKIKGHATAIMGLNVGLEKEGTVSVGDPVFVAYK